MRSMAFIFMLLGFAVAVNAQIIREGTLKYNKADRPALIAEIEHSSDVVEAGILEEMKKRGHGKGKSSKGFIEYGGIIFKELSSMTIDVIYVVEEAKKDKGKSVMYMLISKGNDNFMSGSTDAQVFASAREFIKGMMPVLSSMKLTNDIDAHKQLLKDSEKELKDMESKVKGLEKKKKELQEELDEALKAVESQKETVKQNQQKLETLKGQKQ